MKKNRKGQSLIEVMVALLVLTTGFLGILSLLSQSIFLSKTVGQETTATYLAAEGIEIAKNLIDHDVYENLAGLGTGWGTCFGLSGGNYELDYTTTDCTSAALKSYLGSTPPDYLYFDPATHLYVYNFDDLNPTVPTGFQRGIKIIPNDVPGNPSIPEITVQSIVTWEVGGAYQNVTLEDHFYNWHT